MVLATAALAHKDRILSVRMDGAIPELPPAYQATRLHVAFSGGDAGALQQLTSCPLVGRSAFSHACCGWFPRAPFASFSSLAPGITTSRHCRTTSKFSFATSCLYKGCRITPASASCSAFATPASWRSPRLFHSLPRTPSSSGTSACPMTARRKISRHRGQCLHSPRAPDLT
jgi:hypothetical protein